ncbi:MAG: vitamin K epoxide reductase family protein [Anaerolineales bacterium]|nr:vitamin K epoxide reductase family protein [Anaerolineales bacterium]
MKRFLFAIAALLILLSLFPSTTTAAINKQDPQSPPAYQACLAHENMNLLTDKVKAILFWSEGCPHCHEVLENILPPLEEEYGDQLEIILVEISSSEDFHRLFEVAAAYGIPQERVGVPFLIIGDQTLIGTVQIANELPRLIETHLAEGGIAVPENAVVQSFLANKDSSIFQNQEKTPGAAQTPAPTPTSILPMESSQKPVSDGFALAVGTMVLMAAAMIISLISVITGKTYSLPGWTDWLIPVLILAGIGVAGYLSYVETQPVLAICGPVGDCNAVQNSPYALLFGVLPVGVLGLLGYLALFGAWVVRRLQPAWEPQMNVIFWGLALFATLFSLYLTYLEPFVIHAVCMWCITSAVIVTLLLLLGTPKAARSLFVTKRG